MSGADSFCSGGSILAALAQSDGPVPKGNVYATVRGQDQQESLSKLGINVIRLDLNDENALVEAVAHNESAFTAEKLFRPCSLHLDSRYSH